MLIILQNGLACKKSFLAKNLQKLAWGPTQSLEMSLLVEVESEDLLIDPHIMQATCLPGACCGALAIASFAEF